MGGWFHARRLRATALLLGIFWTLPATGQPKGGGAQRELMEAGIGVRLAEPLSSELIWLETDESGKVTANRP